MSLVEHPFGIWREEEWTSGVRGNRFRSRRIPMLRLARAGRDRVAVPKARVVPSILLKYVLYTGLS